MVTQADGFTVIQAPVRYALRRSTIAPNRSIFQTGNHPAGKDRRFWRKPDALESVAVWLEWTPQSDHTTM